MSSKSKSDRIASELSTALGMGVNTRISKDEFKADRAEFSEKVRSGGLSNFGYTLSEGRNGKYVVEKNGEFAGCLKLK
uniref:Uncharacterized protein n=1 Tax=Panagrolaimus sp. PS1159 TaxID=55785 RepID=A0AC35GF99_9BILA